MLLCASPAAAESGKCSVQADDLVWNAWTMPSAAALPAGSHARTLYAVVNSLYQSCCTADARWAVECPCQLLQWTTTDARAQDCTVAACSIAIVMSMACIAELAIGCIYGHPVQSLALLCIRCNVVDKHQVLPRKLRQWWLHCTATAVMVKLAALRVNQQQLHWPPGP